MQASVADPNGIVVATPDYNIRRGVGYGDEGSRRVVSFAQYEEGMKSSEGRAQVRRWAIVMRAPAVDAKGRVTTPGGGEVAAMPAEKYLKWFGQGYRPTVSETDTSLYVFPAPPRPTRWFPSMVEEAISAGEPIPVELAPPGYMGPVFETKRNVVDVGDENFPARPSAGPTIFACDAEDCTRFFDSPQGLAAHTRTEHKSE